MLGNDPHGSDAKSGLGSVASSPELDEMVSKMNLHGNDTEFGPGKMDS